MLRRVSPLLLSRLSSAIIVESVHPATSVSATVTLSRNTIKDSYKLDLHHNGGLWYLVTPPPQYMTTASPALAACFPRDTAQPQQHAVLLTAVNGRPCGGAKALERAIKRGRLLTLQLTFLPEELWSKPAKVVDEEVEKMMRKQKKAAAVVVPASDDGAEMKPHIKTLKKKGQRKEKTERAAAALEETEKVADPAMDEAEREDGDADVASILASFSGGEKKTSTKAAKAPASSRKEIKAAAKRKKVAVEHSEDADTVDPSDVEAILGDFQHSPDKKKEKNIDTSTTSSRRTSKGSMLHGEKKATTSSAIKTADEAQEGEDVWFRASSKAAKAKKSGQKTKEPRARKPKQSNIEAEGGDIEVSISI